MHPQFRKQITTLLAAHYGIAPDDLARPGTTLRPMDPDVWNDWMELIPIGARVGVEVPPVLRERVEAVVAAHPAGHLLSGADFVAAWGGEGAKVEQMKIYMLDKAEFRPFTPAPRYAVRALNESDRVAFDAFLSHCPAEERHDADISLDQEWPFAVFDGARIVAGASTYRWVGLVDVGVLTDPTYRGQGLGKAVVSAVAEHVTAQGQIVCYRHALDNMGSQGIAEGLCFSLYATVAGVHPVT